MIENKCWQEIKRDITIIEIDDNNILVIACDSAGGIGSKKNDIVIVPVEIVGSFTTRVALMEVIAVGAQPISIVNTLSVEYEPTGKKILKGINQEAAKIGLDSNIVINGSTEENFETSQTGLGITVIGKTKKDRIKMASSQKDDLIIAVGLPMVGEEVIQNQELIADLNDLQQIIQLKNVHELLPVGSKGLAYEANLMAKMSGLKLNIKRDLKINLDKSAGPATTFLVSLPVDLIGEVKSRINKPITIIGNLF